jgi:hypothetical protein
MSTFFKPRALLPDEPERFSLFYGVEASGVAATSGRVS